MNTKNASQLLERFVAYQVAGQTVLRVDRACRLWRGWSGLASQVKESSVSVSSNLAEGSVYPNRSAMRGRFWMIALASAIETEQHLDRALDLGLGDEQLNAEARASAGHSARLVTGCCRPWR
jgi:four helix bundle protein